MMPPQRITNRSDSRIDVDRLTSGYHFSNAQGAQAVSGLQPPLAFLFVDLDDLLRHPIDVGEHAYEPGGVKLTGVRGPIWPLYGP